VTTGVSSGLLLRDTTTTAGRTTTIHSLAIFTAASITAAGTPTATATKSRGFNPSLNSPGSSNLTTDAYAPNPIHVSTDATVAWTNNDTQPRTVTSGSNGTPDGKFDSSPNFNPLLVPAQTFSHTFTEPGEYPYFCALHPDMVGTENFKKAEDEEIAGFTANHVGPDHDAVSNSPKIIYEVETFLFQVKSTLDVLAQIIGMIYHMKGTRTYKDDGDILIKNLKNNSSKEQGINAVRLATILEKHQGWVKDTVDMRDEVTHYSDLVGFSCFIQHAWEGGNSARISYPSMPNGDRSRTYLENAWRRLLELINEMSPLIISELHTSPTSTIRHSG
jgi:plastocyanin